MTTAVLGTNPRSSVRRSLSAGFSCGSIIHKPNTAAALVKAISGAVRKVEVPRPPPAASPATGNTPGYLWLTALSIMHTPNTKQPHNGIACFFTPPPPAFFLVQQWLPPHLPRPVPPPRRWRLRALSSAQNSPSWKDIRCRAV